MNTKILPGSFVVAFNSLDKDGDLERQYIHKDNFVDAFKAAKEVLKKYDDNNGTDREFPLACSIAWKADMGDVRRNDPKFAVYQKIGWFNIFGDFKRVFESKTIPGFEQV